MPTPYINTVELDIVPAEYEKFKAAILEKRGGERKGAGLPAVRRAVRGQRPAPCVPLRGLRRRNRLGGTSRDGTFYKVLGDDRAHDHQARGSAHVAHSLQHQGAIATDDEERVTDSARKVLAVVIAFDPSRPDPGH